MARPKAIDSVETPDATEWRVIEFFAGMGLVRRAMESPGRTRWRTLLANDMSPMKRRLYAATFADAGEVFRDCDIALLQPGEIPAADLWTASFPCTDLSLAGKGAGIHSGESSAVWRLLHLLESTPEDRRPAHVLFENVLGLLSSNAGADFRALVGALNRLGYGVDPMCVDAARFVPQSRPRLFLLCARGASAPPPIDPHTLDASPTRPARLIAAMRASDDLIWHARALPPLPARSLALADIIDDEPEDSPRWWSDERADYFRAQVHPGHTEVIERLIAAPCIAYAAGFRRIRPVAPIGGDGPIAKRSVVELRTDGVAGCLRTPKGGSAKQILLRAGRGAFRVRHFSPIECARLQGVQSLPEGFTDNELLFALGDAVCVPAVRWVLDQIEPARADAESRSPLVARTRPAAISTSLFPLPR